MRHAPLVKKKKKEKKAPTKEMLDEILADLIRDLVDSNLDIQEGKVMTTGDAAYRRLDCDQRALAYLRTRPKKHAVRIDVTGLWKTPRTSKLRIPNAGGAATLLVHSRAEARAALKFLIDTVERTRASQQASGFRPRASASVQASGLGPQASGLGSARKEGSDDFVG